MMRHELGKLEPGAPVWVWPERLHFHRETQPEVDALRALLGAQIDAVLEGPWGFRARVSSRGRRCGHGVYLNLVSSVREDATIRVHMDDAQIVSSAEHKARLAAEVQRRLDRVAAIKQAAPRMGETSAPTSPSASAPSPQPSTCEPPRVERPSWADNVRIGSIYVEREPGGTFRVSLVSADGDAKPKQLQTSRGLPVVDVPGAVAACAARLSSIAVGSLPTVEVA